jgi:hypothetical protein
MTERADAIGEPGVFCPQQPAGTDMARAGDGRVEIVSGYLLSQEQAPAKGGEASSGK